MLNHENKVRHPRIRDFRLKSYKQILDSHKNNEKIRAILTKEALKNRIREIELEIEEEEYLLSLELNGLTLEEYEKTTPFIARKQVCKDE